MNQKELFKQQHEDYTSNVFSMKMVEPLADELGVCVESLMKLGVGCRPGRDDKGYESDNRTYTFPIRSASGDVIGMSVRYENGKKILSKGSKQGLFFEPCSDLDGGSHGKSEQRFIRVQSAGVTCPICSKPDWCLVSIDDPADPSAVVCGRVEDGCEKVINESGFLHIRKDSGRIKATEGSIIQGGDDYVLVTEGATDTVAGIDLGFVTVGRTNALCGIKELAALLRGRKVIIVGDNDGDSAKHVGQRGMDKVAASLQVPCESVIKILPPTEYKDLRSWKKATNLTKDQFLDWVKKEGAGEAGESLLGSDVAFEIVKTWLSQNRMVDGIPDVRFFQEQWVKYSDGHYSDVTPDSIRGELYRHLEGMMYLNEAGVATPYKITRAKVTDMTDALKGLCNIEHEAPCWLEDRGLPGTDNLIAFRNGILDIEEYINGRIKMYDATPALFSYNVLPYDFDENAHSVVWEDFVNDIFNDDPDKFKLLSQWFGYNCVPDMSYEKLMLLTGRPRSGKGTVINTMISMLGRDQCTGTSFQNLCSEFGYQPLVGKLAAIMGDAKVTKRTESAKALEKILQIVGGDPVGIRKMYKGTLGETHLTCRFTIAMNDLPNLPDNANALEPRMNVLNFMNTYMGREDRGLKKLFKGEAEAGKIINFALTGLRSLRLEREFIEPSDSRETLREQRELTQPVSAFIAECCEMMPPDEDEKGYFIDKNMMYEVWVQWCVNTGRHPSNSATFGRWIKMACPLLHTARLQIKGRRVGVYRKIRLAEWVKREYFGA